MTTYSAITAGQIDAESYIDTTLAGQWTNNLIAVTEQATGAPTIKGTWIELADSGVVSGVATVDFEGFDTTYDDLMIRCIAIIPATDDVELRLRVGTGGTPTYQTGSVYSLQNAAINASDHMSHATSGLGNATDETYDAEINIHNIDGAAYFKSKSESTYYKSTGVLAAGSNSGAYTGLTAVTALRLYLESGNISSGQFILYGFKKS